MGEERTRWCTNVAYAVGLLTADGSLSSDQRHIDFTSKDIDLIKIFQNCLGLQHCKIGVKRSGSSENRKYYRVQFSDVRFYRWLQSIGLQPRKSTTIKYVAIPDEYYFDFVRGLFDGDGTAYAYKDPRWKGSITVTIGFASGSTAFLDWLRSGINQRLHTTGFITNGSRVQQLRYGYHDAHKLFAVMYKNNSAPKLKRKFAKMRKILRIGEPQV
ncbi:hypothetical protein CL655_00570 [bacterium]|nr:hypothetical protein [bacterium]